MQNSCGAGRARIELGQEAARCRRAGRAPSLHSVGCDFYSACHRAACMMRQITDVLIQDPLLVTLVRLDDVATSRACFPVHAFLWLCLYLTREGPGFPTEGRFLVLA